MATFFVTRERSRIFLKGKMTSSGTLHRIALSYCLVLCGIVDLYCIVLHIGTGIHKHISFMIIIRLLSGLLLICTRLLHKLPTTNAVQISHLFSLEVNKYDPHFMRFCTPTFLADAYFVQFQEALLRLRLFPSCMI